MQMLPIIVFSLVFGGVLTTLGEKGKPVIAFFDAVNDAIMKMVHLIMWIAPLGVFGLVAYQFAAAGDWAKLLESLGRYMATVLIGLAVHAFVVLPVLCVVLGHRNPVSHFAAMLPAILTAWSTASSSATLPLTMDCAEERAGLSKRAAGFVLPLGATVNMDGTALYESVAAIFIAQAFGIELTGMQTLLIFITATLASIGAAGIPQAGLTTMIIVLTAVDLPLEGVGLLLAVDWLLDRFRTAINVWGDSVGVAYIDRVAGPDIKEPPTGGGGAV
jgi:Na+/H+-dicarboxylate symporter